jgi:hypothetical protein
MLKLKEVAAAAAQLQIAGSSAAPTAAMQLSLQTA